MSVFCCNSRNCVFGAILASLITGVITAILSFTAVITITPAFLWVLFGISVLYLVFLSLASVRRQRGITSGCLYSALPALLVGILGTILTSVVLLGITFAATSVLGALIGGALLAFFALTVTSSACIIVCTASCDRNTIS